MADEVRLTFTSKEDLIEYIRENITVEIDDLTYEFEGTTGYQASATLFGVSLGEATVSVPSNYEK